MYPKLITLRSARTPQLGRLTTLLVLAIATAGLTGCSESSGPTAAPDATTPDLQFEPNALTLTPGDTARTTVRVETGADLRGATFTLDGAPPGLTTRFEAAADGKSGTLSLAASPNVSAIAWSLTVKGRKGDGTKTWVGNLSLNISGSAVRAIFVDPLNGNDTNPGSETKPLKTLGKALSKARSGDTVKLAAGGYGPTATSGEPFPASGLAVPAGVAIEGALDGGFPVSTLVGTGSGVGLNFAGDATVRNLVVGGAGFGVGMFAKQGKQTLSNIFLGVRLSGAGVDGVPLNGGLVLRGTAEATLLAGASGSNTTGSTIFLNSGTGVDVSEQARFTMNGGQITGGTVNCRKDAIGIALNGSAQVTVTSTNGRNNVFPNIGGRALAMAGTSKATVSVTTITRTYPDGCFPGFGVVEVRQSASLTLNSSTIQGIGGSNAVGIDARTDMPLTLDAPTIEDFSGTGIQMGDPGKPVQLVITRGLFLRNKIGIDASHAPNVRVDISDGSFLEATNGVVLADNIKVRGSTIFGRNIGILLSGMKADLGTAADPGGNTFTVDALNTFGSALRIAGNLPGLVVSAVGNKWRPNVQGADSQGLYIPGTQVNSSSPLAKGPNFDLSAGTKIQF